MGQDQPVWHFIVNPAAGRGRGLGRWRRWEPALRRALPGLRVHYSTAAEGVASLAERIVRAGATHLVGVGGDGTHHGVLGGIVAAGGLGAVTYAPLACGTGNDWVRTLGTPRALGPWLATLLAGRTIAHGVGVLSRTAPPAAPAPAAAPRVTYFLNVAGLAYDAEVVRRSETARLKRRWLYPLLTLAYLRGFVPPTVRVDYDGGSITGPVHTVNVGIGRYNGGGMRLVPHADPTAPTLALTVARRLPLWRILAQSWRFYTPTIGRVAGVTTTTTRRVTVTTLAGANAAEADGEWLGPGTVTITLAPQRLRVIVPHWPTPAQGGR